MRILFSQLFDSDRRVVKTVCDVLPQIIARAELEIGKTDMFSYTIPDWFNNSGLYRIPMVNFLAQIF